MEKAQEQNKSIVWYIAFTVSRVFGPFTVMPLINLYILIFRTLQPGYWISAGGVLVATRIIFPALLFFYLVWRKKITDIDVTDRSQRNQWLNWALLSDWIGLAILFSVVFSPNDLFTTLFGQLLFFTNAVMTIVTLITTRYKVSLHMSGATTAAVMLSVVLGWAWFWLGIVLIAVAWSRLYQKKHTIYQLVLGFGIPVVTWWVLAWVLML